MEEFLGCDMAMEAQDLKVSATGDVKLVSGRACLAQDILNALMTPKGSLLWHPEYGFDIYKYVKKENSAINRLQFVQEVKTTVEADPRVQPGHTRVEVLTWNLRLIRFKVSALPINETHPLNLVLGYGAYSVEGEVTT